MADRDSGRLDQPREVRRSRFTRPSYNPEAFGRASERFARFMGTGQVPRLHDRVRARSGSSGTSSRPRDLRFDAYPFIFLTLMLSLQASYAAPLILLAQNRQDDRDRVVAGAGPQPATSATSPTPSTSPARWPRCGSRCGEVATRDFLRSELRSLLEEIEERGSSDHRHDGRSDRYEPRHDGGTVGERTGARALPRHPRAGARPSMDA